MKRRKVCIVGFAGGYGAIPWADPTWELWGFNQMYRSIRPSARHPFSRWFELHLPRYFDRDASGNPDEGWPVIAGELNQMLHPVSDEEQDAELARNLARGGLITTEAHRRIARAMAPERYGCRPVPLVYLPAADPLVPDATVYPRAKVERLAPHGAYHAGSFDWMVALAILEGFKHIRLAGVNFALGGEPISGRPCLEYWLGVAEAKGITVEVVGSTDLFRIFHLCRSDTPYGFAPWALVEDHAYQPPHSGATGHADDSCGAEFNEDAT